MEEDVNEEEKEKERREEEREISSLNVDHHHCLQNHIETCHHSKEGLKPYGKVIWVNVWTTSRSYQLMARRHLKLAWDFVVGRTEGANNISGLGFPLEF